MISDLWSMIYALNAALFYGAIDKDRQQWYVIYPRMASKNLLRIMKITTMTYSRPWSPFKNSFWLCLPYPPFIPTWKRAFVHPLINSYDVILNVPKSTGAWKRVSGILIKSLFMETCQCPPYGCVSMTIVFVHINAYLCTSYENISMSYSTLRAPWYYQRLKFYKYTPFR